MSTGRRRATIELQPWPYPGRPRVLIERPDPDEALELAAALRARGWTVGICRGPDAAADPALRCPLHRLEPCVAVAGADVVVMALDLEEPDARDVLRGLRSRYQHTPVVVLATVAEALELEDALGGCRVLPVDSTPELIAAAVQAQLARPVVGSR